MPLVYAPVSIGAVGNSELVNLAPSEGNTLQIPVPMTIGLLCSLSNGAALSYSVQFTCDPPGAAVNWQNHDILVNLATSKYGYLLYPVSAIRLTVLQWVRGSVSMGVVRWP